MTSEHANRVYDALVGVQSLLTDMNDPDQNGLFASLRTACRNMMHIASFGSIDAAIDWHRQYQRASAADDVVEMCRLRNLWPAKFRHPAWAGDAVERRAAAIETS